jgi:hypothetical protein
MILNVDSYDDFLGVCGKLGTPHSVFYNLTSGNVVFATALFLGGYAVFGSTVNGSQSEASFLTEFPSAVEVSESVSLRSD